MKPFVGAGSWLAAPPPTVAIEVASRRISVLGLAPSGARTVRALATESLPDGVLVPQLSGPNVADREAVATALSRAIQRAGLGGQRRAALVVPDSVARVSLVPLASVPSRPAELDQILRWQLRKSMPFPLDQAQLTYFPANRSDETSYFAAVVARREVIQEYEALTASVGIHAGIVDLAGFSVMNVVIGGPDAAGDALVIHVAAEATTLAILRHRDLMFYRHRTAVDEEPLGSLVHQTAMYYEDRLGGSRFSHVWVSGASLEERAAISARLGVDAAPVDVQRVVDLPDGPARSPDMAESLAATVGVLIRERKAA